MDDYVAKPIRTEELVGALERCRHRPEPRPGGAPDAGVPEERPGIDQATLERLTATMGDAFVGELINTFLGDAAELVAALRRGQAGPDVDAFRRAAHSLRSNSETLGALGLAALARELETMARAGRVDGVGHRLEQLAAEYDRVVRSLGGLRRGIPA
jgi:HPt (histidine-containing phosphotransfer) domain-containing protein